jgi:hypothetical protein
MLCQRYDVDARAHEREGRDADGSDPMVTESKEETRVCLIKTTSN